MIMVLQYSIRLGGWKMPMIKGRPQLGCGNTFMRKWRHNYTNCGFSSREKGFHLLLTNREKNHGLILYCKTWGGGWSTYDDWNV